MMGNLENLVAHGQPFSLYKDSVASQKWFLKKKKKSSYPGRWQDFVPKFQESINTQGFIDNGTYFYLPLTLQAPLDLLYQTVQVAEQLS